jgi:hypothetical protein
MKLLPLRLTVFVLAAFTVPVAWAQGNSGTSGASAGSVAGSSEATPSKTVSKKPTAARRNPVKPLPPGSKNQHEKTNAGVVIFLDPATGEIREPSAQEIEELTRRIPPTESGISKATSPGGPAEGVTEAIRGAGGAVGMVLGPEFQREIVVTRTDDGKLQMDECMPGQKAVACPNLMSTGSRHEAK